MCDEQGQMSEIADTDFIYAWQKCNDDGCFNPITGLPIRRGSRTYGTLLRYYNQEVRKNNFCNCTSNDKYFVPDDNMLAQHYMMFGGSGIYRSRHLDDPTSIDLEYIREWRTNSSAVPHTHEPVIMSSPLWKHCEARCRREEFKLECLTHRAS